jgi:FMN phosphatase YigB (HAD superfamily)
LALLPSQQLIVFDLDGTLYEHPYLKLQLGLKLWRSLRYLKRLEPSRNQIRSKRFTSGEALRAAQARTMDPASSRRAQSWYHAQFYPQFISCLHPRWSRPGLSDLLKKIRSKGIHTAVLSDYSCVQERLLRLGIEPKLFDQLASAEDDGHLKPGLSSYLRLAEKFKVPPERMLIVGDRPETDGVAAQAIGAAFVHIASALEWEDFITHWETQSTWKV